MTLQEMRERREALRKEIAGLQSSLQERRSAGKVGADLWTADDQGKFDKAKADFETIQGQIEAEERSSELDSFLANTEEQRSKQARDGVGKDDVLPGNRFGTAYGEIFNDRDAARRHFQQEEKRSLAFQGFLMQAMGQSLNAEQRNAMSELKVEAASSFRIPGPSDREFRSMSLLMQGNNTAENRRAAYGSLEKRAITYAQGTAFVPTILADSFEVMFQAGESIIPLIDVILVDDPSPKITHPGADDNAEGKQVDETVDPNWAVGADPALIAPTLDNRTFESLPVKLSETLLRATPFNLAQILGSLLGGRLARAMGNKLATGVRANGTFGGYMLRGALGVTMASKSAFPISELMKLKMSLIQLHRDQGTFLLADETVAGYAGLLDTTGRFLLDVDNKTLLNRPYRIQTWLPTPAAVAAGSALKPIAFGNLSMIKMKLQRDTVVTRLGELFQNENKIGFNAKRDADADLMCGPNAANNPIKYMQAPV